MVLSIELGKSSAFFCFAKGASFESFGRLPSKSDVELVDVLANEADSEVLLWSEVRFLYSFGKTSSAIRCLKGVLIQVLFRGCRRQPLYCFHLDFRCVTLVRYIYIYNIDLKKSLIIENLYNSNREV